MPVRRHAATTAALLGFLALMSAPALAQQDWQGDLANEILLMEDCEVSFLTQVVERDLDGRVVILAKVHCVDGRTFDASRDDNFAAFEFRACEPDEAPATC